MEYQQACDLVARILERARLDATGKTGGSVSRICRETEREHRARNCATEFLDLMETAVLRDKQPTSSDILQAYLEVTK